MGNITKDSVPEESEPQNKENEEIEDPLGPGRSCVSTRGQIQERYVTNILIVL